MRRYESLQSLAETITVFVLYFVSGKLGLSLASLHPNASPVWPPSGIALVALLVLGYRAWPAVFLGAFTVNVTTSGSAATALLIGTGNTAEAIVGAWLVQRLAFGRRAMETPRGVIGFLVAALLSTTVSATVGVAGLNLTGLAAWSRVPSIWITWWMGDATGVLVVAPFLLTWANHPRPLWTGRWGEVALLFVTILGIAWVVFTGVLPISSSATPMAALCLPPLLWAGFRFSPREVATGTVLLAAAAIRGALHKTGPFAGATPNETLLLLQSFVGIVSVMAMAVAAQVRQSRSIETELHAVREDLDRRVEERTRVLSSVAAERRRSDEKFHDLLEAAPDAMVIADTDGRILQVNARTEMMFGAARTELVGSQMDNLLAERLRASNGGPRESGLGISRLRSMGEGGELFGQRRDGTEFPIDISVSPLETEQGLMLTAAIRDITRRRHYEESVARLAAIVACSDDAIVSTDPDGIITSWNAAAERLLGYTAQEALGRSSAILAAPGLPGETDRAPEKLKRMKQVHYDSRSMRKDGTVVEVGITSFPVRDRSGRTIGFSSILRDLTDQRRAEEERHERDALQSQVSELSSRTHEISVLNELGEVLRSAVRPAEAYPVIPRFLSELFPGESGALYEFNEAHQLMETAMHWGDAPPQEDAFLPSECWGLRRGQTHLVDDPRGSMLCQHVRPPTLAGALCIPLTARGKTLGLMHLMGAPEGRVPSGDGAVVGEYRQRLAQTVAQQISSALFDLRLQETLREQATRDPLTGLFNRRYMEETLHRELYRAARKKTRVGFVLFDLDHFKSYNDRYGHASGDAALREVSSFVQRHSRAEDIVCRYGGEEFLMVLSDCSSADLVRRAEQIRQGVKALKLEHNQRDLGTITLSAGVALFPDHGRSVDELFHVADAALYQAKKDGRDRVTVADALPSVMVPPRPGEKERQH